MALERASGVLLHPTSFPGPGGIGELGSAAYAFVDWLAAAGQSYWQILPLGPTGYGDSPYASFSAYAGNPLLISLEQLAADGLLTAAEVAGGDAFSHDWVDFGPVIEWKLPLLQQTYDRRAAHPALAAEFAAFCQAEAAWLDDYALFSALKAKFGGVSWNAWDAPVRGCDAAALSAARAELAEPIAVQQWLQFLFFRQWRALKRYANSKAIRILGDIPIFVAYDSADVWANPELFFLDEQGNSTVVAGVPPDYFSATGQRWGNPLYRWDVLAKQGYQWWIRASGRCSTWWTGSASIISAASRPTGRCRPARRPPSPASGSRGRASRFSMRSARRSATCRSSPRIWA